MVWEYPMEAAARFTAAHNWAGGSYELAVEIGPNDDARLDRALTALGPALGVADWYGTIGLEPYRQQPVPGSLASWKRHGSLTGIVRLPDGRPIVCEVLVVREEDGSDWVDFGLPFGALERAYPQVDDLPLAAIDTWLAQAGENLYAAIDYQLGLIGFPASGGDSAARVLAEGPPEKRTYGYLIPIAGRITYLPSTG
ncbi:hypothetical protein [Amycolatopsis albispora]|uniref:Uncharacterized protein n=1 Tax=Amycolatopsis albispora TaxID=1804986 RepID=A0A344L0J6_9PSEU|nr:hypothetical protein [Amycolatopsis albispora]AXB41570.1 hypothetical protein A4R43_02735 [Amycolatopsis albispora]